MSNSQVHSRQYTYCSISIGSNSYSFAYDNSGNPITENTDRHFEWDYADQMRSFYIQVKTDEYYFSLCSMHHLESH